MQLSWTRFCFNLDRSVVRGLLFYLRCFLAFAGLTLSVCAQSPFEVSGKWKDQNGTKALEVHFEFPPKHVLYEEKLSFAWIGGGVSNRFELPPSVSIYDKFTKHEKKVFNKPFTAISSLPGNVTLPLTFEVHYQGCDEENCYFPEEKRFQIQSDGKVTEVAVEEEPASVASSVPSVGSWKELAANFQVVARGSGFMKEQPFLEFLAKADSGGTPEDSGAASFGTGWRAVLSVLVILLGGMALNLTPCVLPLIPINLAIIGAGSRAGSRARGFALGGAYAAGMSLAYGILGLVVVLTGSKFGTLNSSPWFNLAIGAVFIVLAMGMFDWIHIDLSKFQSGRSPRPGAGQGGGLIIAYSMGTVAALLAGACVAPVVISVLLQATQLYGDGVMLGLALPFVLGIGMALPWPFAGAGLSFLPKPGAWMSRIKHGFGVLIALFAAYYLYLAVGLFQSGSQVSQFTSTDGKSEGAAAQDVSGELDAALRRALAENRPVFIDFWATWCKNCSAMEHSTFNRPAVKSSLDKFVQVRLQAERPNAPGIKPVLDYFGALGLPTYVVISPKSKTKTPPNNKTSASVTLPPYEAPDPRQRLL